MQSTKASRWSGDVLQQKILQPYNYGHWQARNSMFNARRRVSAGTIIVLCYFTFTDLCTQT